MPVWIFLIFLAALFIWALKSERKNSARRDIYNLQCKQELNARQKAKEEQERRFKLYRLTGEYIADDEKVRQRLDNCTAEKVQSNFKAPFNNEEERLTYIDNLSQFSLNGNQAWLKNQTKNQGLSQEQPQTEIVKKQPEFTYKRESSNFDSNKITNGFVYFIRNRDLYKIGITKNLAKRLKQLKPDEVLRSACCPNYRELEKALHKNFKDERIPQTEYFRLSKKQIDEVHLVLIQQAKSVT